MKRAILSVACLLAAAPAFGQERQQGRIPKRFIKVELLDVGEFVPFGDWEAWSVHLASVTCVIDRVRFGVTAADMYTAIDFWDGTVLLPFHVGYNIVSNPKATWLLWGAVPDVHVDAIGSLWKNRDTGTWPPSLVYSPTIEVAGCCDVDYYGFGAGLRVGAYRSGVIGYGQNAGLFAELRIRALTFGIGF